MLIREGKKHAAQTQRNFPLHIITLEHSSLSELRQFQVGRKSVLRGSDNLTGGLWGLAVRQAGSRGAEAASGVGSKHPVNFRTPYYAAGWYDAGSANKGRCGGCREGAAE